MPVSSLLSRRHLLDGAAAIAAAAIARPLQAASLAPRSVSLYNIHTGEWLRTVYWADGHYISEAVRDINWILRDHWSGEVALRAGGAGRPAGLPTPPVRGFPLDPAPRAAAPAPGAPPPAHTHNI